MIIKMATEAQLQQVIDLLQQQQQQINDQMKTMTTLQAENAALKNSQTGQNAGGSTSGNSKFKKPDRPVINAGIDDREWALFLDSWSRYKSMVGVAVTDVATIRQELRTACSPEVNKMLFEYVGASVLNACTETNLLEHIKSVAVKTVHKEVHRMAFSKMIQNQGESITCYVARLRSKAFLCEFEVKCSCTPVTTVSYANEMVAQQLVAGLCNADHQRKVLSEATTLSTLALKIERLQVLETTEASAVELHQSPPPSEAAASHYKREKRKKVATTPTPPMKENQQPANCRWCGNSSHPEGKSLERINCPAREKTCFSCDKKGHFSTVCENSKSASANVRSISKDGETLPTIESESAVSFSFAGHQDFRQTRKRNDNR